jgi:capsule polysaccharide export protein KpsE/RkpR
MVQSGKYGGMQMTRLRAFGSLLSLIPLMVALPSISHAQYTLVLQSGQTYEIQEASEFVVNGKDFGRILPGGTTAVVNPSNVGKLRQQKYSGSLSLRKSPEGVLMSRSDSGWQNWIPEGRSKAPETAASLWSHARIEYRKNRAEKTLTPISWQNFFLLVPGQDSAENLARVLADPRQFAWTGADVSNPNADRSPKDILSEQVNLRAALVNAYPKSAAATRIHEASLDSMRKYAKWEDGGLPVTDLEEGIDFGAAAVRAFPDDPELAALLNRLRTRREWIDREVAILSAMKAGEQCDGLLAKYSEFEPSDSSFGNLADARRACYASSADAHVEAGRRLASKNDVAGALREFRIAKQRSPGNESVRYELENVRLAAARAASNELRNRPPAETISTAQIELARHLQLAERNLTDGNQSQVDDELRRAAAIDPRAPQIQLTMARIAQARGELSKANSYLEGYESAGIPADQLSSAEQLRTSINYDLQKRVQALRERVSKAVEEHHFLNAMNASVEGLTLDADDVQFLYQAGANAAIMRKPGEAKRLLERYLKVSDSLAGDRTQRRIAMAVLRKIGSDSGEGPATSGFTRCFEKLVFWIGYTTWGFL